MRLTRKGIKMNISKCLRKYDIQQSEEVTTEIRGQHDFTNGYRFLDVEDSNEIIMYWHNDELENESKQKKIKNIYDLLILHGFSEYIELKENEVEISITSFRE